MSWMLNSPLTWLKRWVFLVSIQPEIGFRCELLPGRCKPRPTVVRGPDPCRWHHSGRRDDWVRGAGRSVQDDGRCVWDSGAGLVDAGLQPDWHEDRVWCRRLVECVHYHFCVCCDIVLVCFCVVFSIFLFSVFFIIAFLADSQVDLFGIFFALFFCWFGKNNICRMRVFTCYCGKSYSSLLHVELYKKNYMFLIPKTVSFTLFESFTYLPKIWQWTSKC